LPKMDTGEKPLMSTDTSSTSVVAAASSPNIFSLPTLNLSSLVPQPFRDWHQSLNDWRDRLGLTSPGTSEGLHKEVQRDVFLTNYMFSGMKADLGRNFSANPLFQVQHSFSAGSSQAAPWSFLSLYATDNVSPLFWRFVC
jgi:mitochondrial import receptor subunit TOM40